MSLPTKTRSPNPSTVTATLSPLEILRMKRKYPTAAVRVMAGDVSTAFRNISIHSRSVHLFAGCIKADNVFDIVWLDRFPRRV